MWNIPELRFSHLIEVKEKAGVDLSDLDSLVNLDNVVELAKVIKVLSPTPFDENFHGEQIQYASDQLFDRVTDFFPSAKAEAIRAMRIAVAEAYQKMGQEAGASGKPSTSSQDS